MIENVIWKKKKKKNFGLMDGDTEIVCNQTRSGSSTINKSHLLVITNEFKPNKKAEREINYTQLRDRTE